MSWNAWPERVAGLRAKQEEDLTYLEHYGYRWVSPTYEANGWYLGSGVIESGCQKVSVSG